MQDSVFNELKDLVTEKSNPGTIDIDTKSIREILYLINNEDKTVPLVVEKEIPYIEKAIEMVIASFKKDGRLIYVGAGTSGRLGILDASECPPTFGVEPELVQGLIAGGFAALIRAQEGAEDNKDQAERDFLKLKPSQNDVICGIAASRRTPYVVAVVEKAKIIGCKTIFVTCTPREELKLATDVAICPVVGPEVIMGSTRMKAGTATKLVLNMITTTTMIRLGKVYRNMMVDLKMTSKKLEERSKRTVMMVTGVDYDTAAEVLEQARGHVKTALVMILAGVDAREATRRLDMASGFVRGAIGMVLPGQ